jgi:hypothetical protein
MHPPGSAVIGNDGIGTDSRTIGNNQIHGNRFIAPGDMRITELRASVVGLLDGSFTTAVYADNNGRPDRLLRSSQLVTSPTNGWNTFPLTEALDLTGGRAYWFALWSDSPGAVLPGDNFGTTYMGTYSYANLGGVWPDPISLPTPNAETRTYLIYAEGTPLTAAPGPQADVRGNGKLIISGDTTPTTLDGTDFGSLPQGMGTVEHTFTIQNPGANPLQLSADDPVAITGAAARDFEVLSQPASTIPAGGSGTFTVRFSPSVKGVRAATLVIANNDINPEKNPYQFTVRGAGLPVARESLWPDSTVGADVGNDGTYYELGTIFQASVPGEVTQIRVFSVGGDDGEHTVWLWRTADQAVVGGPYIWNFGGVTGWIYLDIPPVAIEPATDYTVSISTGTGPMRNYANIPGVVASGGSNGQHLSYPANAGVFIDNQPGAMPTQSYNGSTYLRDIVFVPATNTIGFPRMAVIGNANLIPDGYSSPVATNYTDFGLGSAGAGAVERTFVITNSGNAPLKLVGTPLVEVQGANAGEFSVVAEPADTIPAGGTASFTIRFSPAAVGARRAVMAIQNDDKNPYYFTVSGTGDQVVPITFRVTSITTDIAAGNVTIQWEGPDQQFQVERATSASGPFAPLGAPQSAKSYTDVGALQNNAQLFYRVRY